MTRDQQKHRRRADILEATLAVIAREGLAGTTLADIAREAGTSYGLVAFHFGSKDALLLAALEALAADYEAAWRAALDRLDPAAGPAERLDALLASDFHHAVASPRRIAAWSAFWSESRSHPAYRRRLVELADGYLVLTRDLCAGIIEEGGYPHDPAMVAAGINAMVDGLWLDLQIRPGPSARGAALAACRAMLAALFPKEFAGPHRKRRA